jgi:hypothetical protein
MSSSSRRSRVSSSFADTTQKIAVLRYEGGVLWKNRQAIASSWNRFA